MSLVAPKDRDEEYLQLVIKRDWYDMINGGRKAQFVMGKIEGIQMFIPIDDELYDELDFLWKTLSTMNIYFEG